MIYIDHDYAMIHLVSESSASNYEYVSFKSLRNTRTQNYFRASNNKKRRAVDYEMITVCFETAKTIEKWIMRSIAGIVWYTQPKRRAQSMRNNTVECCLMTKSNKNIPSTTADPPVQLDQKTFEIRWDIISLIVNIRC